MPINLQTVYREAIEIIDSDFIINPDHVYLIAESDVVHNDFGRIFIVRTHSCDYLVNEHEGIKIAKALEAKYGDS